MDQIILPSYELLSTYLQLSYLRVGKEQYRVLKSIVGTKEV